MKIHNYGNDYAFQLKRRQTAREVEAFETSEQTANEQAAEANADDQVQRPGEGDVAATSSAEPAAVKAAQAEESQAPKAKKKRAGFQQQAEKGEGADAV